MAKFYEDIRVKENETVADEAAKTEAQETENKNQGKSEKELETSTEEVAPQESEDKQVAAEV